LTALTQPIITPSAMVTAVPVRNAPPILTAYHHHPPLTANEATLLTFESGRGTATDASAVTEKRDHLRSIAFRQILPTDSSLYHSTMWRRCPGSLTFLGEANVPIPCPSRGSSRLQLRSAAPPGALLALIISPSISNSWYCGVYAPGRKPKGPDSA
jgi:hypothetical protein